jgi:hypothetical protein
VVDSDHFNFISAINSRGQERSPFWNTIKEIQVLASESRVCKFVKLDRSQVRISHWLIAWSIGPEQRAKLIWFDSVPDVLLQSLESELLVIPID